MDPSYFTRKGPHQIGLMNQLSMAPRDVAMSCLHERMHWPTPCPHDLTRNLFCQMSHQWHPGMLQCPVDMMSPWGVMVISNIH